MNLISVRDAMERLMRTSACWLVLAWAGQAHASYFLWETVELPVSSASACGNGTPYRFFVNRTPFTSSVEKFDARPLADKWKLYPIPVHACELNSALTQNAGWTDGICKAP